jgi:lipopolysaccharide/colanic/teichoic acid biosynthesis glycosyltransferase
MKSLRSRVLIADLCWSVIAMAVSYGVRYGGSWQNPTRIPVSDFLPFLLFTFVFWTALSFWVHLDGFHGGWRLPAILSQLVPAISALIVLLLAGAYLARWYMSRLVLNGFGLLLFLGFLGIRLLARARVVSQYRSGAVRKAVIVGSGPIASEIARKVESHPEMLLEIVGFLSPAESASSLRTANEESINVRSAGIVDLLRCRAIDELILAVTRPDHPEVSDLVARCLNQGISVSLVPQPYALYLSQPKLVDLDGLPLLKLQGVHAIQATPFWKRLLDLSLTVCLLPVVGPGIFVAAAWLKIRKGRGFRSEMRCGQNGKMFLMYRLNSDRTAIGLRLSEFLMQQSSFTELPQLLNVLRGEMSLVGPRPEGPEKVRHYSDWHRQRLSVRPGMTGLAQVHGLRDHNSSEDKTCYDLQYILHRSPFLDVSLLLQTLWTLAVRPLPGRLQPRLQPLVLSEIEPTFQESFSRAHSSQSGTD